MSNTVTVAITQEIIDAATAHKAAGENALGRDFHPARHCVTARALSVALGEPVEMLYSYWYPHHNPEGCTYQIPRSLQRVQKKFDANQTVKPVTLRVQIRERK